jgi:hypothetical protein
LVPSVVVATTELPSALSRLVRQCRRYRLTALPDHRP